MLSVMLFIALAVFGLIVTRANQNKREQIRIPLYIENTRPRRRRHE